MCDKTRFLLTLINIRSHYVGRVLQNHRKSNVLTSLPNLYYLTDFTYLFAVFAVYDLSFPASISCLALATWSDIADLDRSEQVYFLLVALLTVVSHQTVAGAPRRTIQSGKYNEMDPILIGTAVSVVTYTDFIALVTTRQTFV